MIVILYKNPMDFAAYCTGVVFQPYIAALMLYNGWSRDMAGAFCHEILKN